MNADAGALAPVLRQAEPPRMPPTKLSVLLAAIAAERWPEALRIAARFPDLGAHRAAILDAHQACVNPRWARSLGKDPAALIAAGKAALVARYVKP
jgi:hypothetical protein